MIWFSPRRYRTRACFRLAASCTRANLAAALRAAPRARTRAHWHGILPLWACLHAIYINVYAYLPASRAVASATNAANVGARGQARGSVT